MFLEKSENWQGHFILLVNVVKKNWNDSREVCDVYPNFNCTTTLSQKTITNFPILFDCISVLVKKNAAKLTPSWKQNKRQNRPNTEKIRATNIPLPFIFFPGQTAPLSSLSPTISPNPSRQGKTAVVEDLHRRPRGVGTSSPLDSASFDELLPPPTYNRQRRGSTSGADLRRHRRPSPENPALTHPYPHLARPILHLARLILVSLYSQDLGGDLDGGNKGAMKEANFTRKRR